MPYTELPSPSRQCGQQLLTHRALFAQASCCRFEIKPYHQAGFERRRKPQLPDAMSCCGALPTLPAPRPLPGVPPRQVRPQSRESWPRQGRGRPHSSHGRRSLPSPTSALGVQRPVKACGDGGLRGARPSTEAMAWHSLVRARLGRDRLPGLHSTAVPA